MVDFSQKTLLQINTVINSGSTGHIAEELGNLAIKNGWKSYIAYGRNPRPSKSEAIKIGSKFGIYFHVFITRFFDLHGFGSYFATKKLIKKIKDIKPDVIHLHNIHGYYLNIKVLFDYLKTIDTPVIWTLHDCWTFTGHCSYYTAVDCNKWKEQCFDCPQKKQYPKSLFDNSKSNYLRKKKIFTGVKNLTIVTPSEWLSNQVKLSFLSKYSVKVINNGIDLNIFKPTVTENKSNKFIILGVASVWDERKGIDDFINLSKMLTEDEEIIMIGLSEDQISTLPENIKGIKRTESQAELIRYYSESNVYFNASVEETLGMTTVEAQACGTPVIVYNSTAIPETVSSESGFCVNKNDVNMVYEKIQIIKKREKSVYIEKCREFVKTKFDANEKWDEYMKLYEKIL